MPREHRICKGDREYEDPIQGWPDWYWKRGLHDTLTQHTNSQYQLSLVLENSKGKHFSLEITFQFAETKRK